MEAGFVSKKELFLVKQGNSLTRYCFNIEERSLSMNKAEYHMPWVKRDVSDALNSMG